MSKFNISFKGWQNLQTFVASLIIVAYLNTVLYCPVCSFIIHDIRNIVDVIMRKGPCTLAQQDPSLCTSVSLNLWSMCLLQCRCKLVLTQYSALITYELYYTAVAVTGSIYSIIKQLLYIDVECDYCVAANLASAGNLHTCILHYCEQLG